MKFMFKTFLVGTIILANLSAYAQDKPAVKPKLMYKSKGLIITAIAENTFEHTSYLTTNDFGKVPCNGLIVRSRNEVAVFDTPSSDTVSEELINWITDNLHCKIIAIIPTHFHNDCLGGLKAFHDKGISSYAYFKTVELARQNHFIIPQNSFRDSFSLKLGDASISARFFGEGHTKDNVVAYFPGENILFGGCLIKELDATKGFLGDANVSEWSKTVEKVKQAYPAVKIVVPGHGAYGNAKLLDYTIELFRNH